MAMRRDFQFIFAVVIILLAVTKTVSAIKCYHCNSKMDPYCQDVKANKTAADSYIKECNEPEGGSGNTTVFCRKIVQTLLSEESGVPRVIRKCGFIKSEKACYHYDDEDHAEVVCQCFQDACNAAAQVRPSWRTALTPVAAASLLLLLAH